MKQQAPLKRAKKLVASFLAQQPRQPISISELAQTEEYN
jgi:hypothetical protein